MIDAGALIGAVLPDGVAAAGSYGDPPGVELFPAEQEAIRTSVDKRRREFTTARHCARLALAELGLPPAAIVPGRNREPQWPAGVVGSMTHCDGYRAAAVARSEDFSSLGIDAEPHEPLPEGVLPTIACPEELPYLSALGEASPEVHWDRLLFSAKESVYKTWFPLARCWLGFDEATIEFERADTSDAADTDDLGALAPTFAGVFTATLLQTGLSLGGQPVTQLTGRWLIRNGLVITAISLSSALCV